LTTSSSKDVASWGDSGDFIYLTSDVLISWFDHKGEITFMKKPS